MPTHNQNIEFSKRPVQAAIGNNNHHNNIIMIRKYLSEREDKSAPFPLIRDWMNDNSRWGISTHALSNVLGKSKYFTKVGKEKGITIWGLVE